MSEILFAAEIAARGLHRCMPQQELNLLDLATTAVTQFCTCSSQVVRCNMFQACPFGASLNDIPHNVLGDASPPHFSCLGHGSKDPSLCNLSCLRPLINSRFHPSRNGHSADVAA